jgi:succinyl-diaminopimelate desuccinylase
MNYYGISINMSHPALSLAKQLIAKPSITPKDQGCLALISERLTPLGFQCESLRFGEVDNLWARYGDQTPLFVFAGHTDVVPPGPEAEWETPPFEPSVRDGKLYGRGSSDMKAAIAAMVVAVGQFIQHHPHFPGSIGFLLTSDEEGDAIHGTAKVIETLTARHEKIDYCLVGEPSSHLTLADQIRIGRRGSLHCKLHIHGKQGHVAHPHLADNPIHKSAAAIHELAYTTWDEGNAHYPPTSFQISNIQSGTGALNVIPGHLTLSSNFRFGTALTPEILKEKVTTILKKHELHFDLEWRLTAAPFLTNHGALITATQAAINAITGRDVKLSTGGGTSDGRFIAPTGAEVVELGVRHETAHQINEHIDIEDLVSLTQIYQAILEKLFIDRI